MDPVVLGQVSQALEQERGVGLEVVVGDVEELDLRRHREEPLDGLVDVVGGPYQGSVKPNLNRILVVVDKSKNHFLKVRDLNCNFRLDDHQIIGDLNFFPKS